MLENVAALFGLFFEKVHWILLNLDLKEDHLFLFLITFEYLVISDKCLLFFLRIRNFQSLYHENIRINFHV